MGVTHNGINNLLRRMTNKCCAGARGTPEAGVNDLQIYCTVDEQKGQGIIFLLKERRKTYILML